MTLNRWAAVWSPTNGDSETLWFRDAVGRRPNGGYSKAAIRVLSGTDIQND